MAEKKKHIEYAHGRRLDAHSLESLGILEILREFESADTSVPDASSRYDRVAGLTVMAAFDSYSKLPPEGKFVLPEIDELFRSRPTWKEGHILNVKFNAPRFRPRFTYAPRDLSTEFGLIPSESGLYSIGHHSGPNAGFVDLSPAMSRVARDLIVESIELGNPKLAPNILEGLEGISEAPQV